jgi:hypothetical protein
VPTAILDVRPVTQPIRRRTLDDMSEYQVFGVLLVRAGGQGLDGSFEYLGERLPAIGDEIEVTQPFVAHSLDTRQLVRAKVTGVEKGKTRPIRATEL